MITEVTTPPALILLVSTVVFLIGGFGILVRRNLIAILMCVELMLNAVNIMFVTFSKYHDTVSGHISVCFVMVIATAEAAVGLGLVIAMVRNRKSVETDDATVLRG